MFVKASLKSCETIVKQTFSKNKDLSNAWNCLYYNTWILGWKYIQHLLGITEHKPCFTGNESGNAFVGLKMICVSLTQTDVER